MKERTPPQRMLEATTPFINLDPSDMPSGGVGRIMQLHPDGVRFYVQQPAYGGITALMIASAQVSGNGGRGSGWTLGAPPTTILLDDWDAVEVGDRVGAGSKKWGAVKHDLGPMLVVGKLASPYARVLIGRVRGESLFTMDAHGEWSQAAYFWRLQAPLYATQESPGVMVLTDAGVP